MEAILNEHDSAWVAQAAINRMNDLPDVIIETLKPKIFPDGNAWCCLYGDNLQEGICGFGDTPSGAVYDFTKNYYGQTLTPNIKENKP